MVTLDTIVKDLLSQEGKNTTHDYLRYLNVANNGLKELTFDILGTTKVDLLEVSSALRADLPADFIDYTFVGLVGSNGTLVPLGHKNNIPGVGTQNVAYPINETSLSGYGVGGGQNENGYYSPKIDTSSSPWQMIFTSMAAGKFVYIEYISDGRATDNETVVHPYAQEALTAYVYWKVIQRRRSANQYDKEAARREYFNEKRLARARFASFTKEEALSVIRKGFKQAPKA